MPLKIYFEDEFEIIDDFPSFFKKYTCITAAGGVVINEEDKILMIFRRGKWDLPKGKLEDNESIEVCAEREIKEETGVSAIALEKFLLTTYHTYKENQQPILKETHWYLFRTNGKQNIHPQEEEGITAIKWVPQSELNSYLNESYRLIGDVIESAFSKLF